jgi:hypothetical protein
MLVRKKKEGDQEKTRKTKCAVSKITEKNKGIEEESVLLPFLSPTSLESRRAMLVHESPSLIPPPSPPSRQLPLLRREHYL